jgi:AcrR family transcriptional regulator
VPRPQAITPQRRQRTATAGTDERRERILAAAEGLFFAQGYANTTMNQIVEALDVTKPFVYYYFHNKLEIFETLSWRASVACLVAMDFPPDDARPAHLKVTHGIDTLLHAMLTDFRAGTFAYREPSVFRPEFRLATHRLANAFHTKFQALLTRGREDGWLDFEDATLTSHAVGSLPGFLYTWYRPDGRFPADEVKRQLAEMAHRIIGLRRRRSPAAARA